MGADILDDDLAEVGQTDRLPFTTRVVRDDSIRVYDATANVPTVVPFSFGRAGDEVFGEWSNSVTLTPRLPQSIIDQERITTLPEFATDADTDVDSIVLILPIDTAITGLYGPNRTFQVELSIAAGGHRYYQSTYTVTTPGPPWGVA